MHLRFGLSQRHKPLSDTYIINHAFHHSDVFIQLHEYLGKEALDVMACLSANAEVVARSPTISSTEKKPTNPRPSRTGAASLASDAAGLADEQKLRIVLSGGSSQKGLDHVRPFSLVNDISLLNVLESYRMFGESSATTDEGKGQAKVSADYN